MTPGEIPTRPRDGVALFQISTSATLVAVELVRSLRGHHVDWFMWTLLLMIAASAGSRLATSSRWRVPVRLVFLGSTIATVTGVVLAFFHDRTA